MLKLQEEENEVNLAQLAKLEGRIGSLSSQQEQQRSQAQEQMKEYRVQIGDLRSVQEQLATIADKQIYELQRASLDETMSGKIAKSSVANTNEALSSLNSIILKTLQSYDRVAQEMNRANQASEKVYSQWEKQNMEINDLAQDEAETELEGLVISSKQHILEQHSQNQVVLSQQAKQGIKSEVTDYIDILRGLIVEELKVKWQRMSREGNALFGGQFHQLKQTTAQNVGAILGGLIDQSAVLLALAKGDHEFTQIVCDLIGTTSTMLNAEGEEQKEKLKYLKEEREKQLYFQSALGRQTIDERDEFMKTLCALYLKQKSNQPFRSYSELQNIRKR